MAEAATRIEINNLTATTCNITAYYMGQLVANTQLMATTDMGSFGGGGSN